MPPKAKSEGDIISFLIACVEHSEKTDWQAIAVNTGLYKAGKFSKQAFDGHKKRYGSASGVETQTPTKRKVAANANEDGTPSKKPKSAKAKVAKRKISEEPDEEDEENV